MECTNKRTVYLVFNEKEKKNYIRFGKIEKDDEFIKRIEVPCGQCMTCRMKRSFELKNKILSHQDTHRNEEAYFITLTYAEEKTELDKRDLQLFLKKLRKEQKEKISYVATGEYGEISQRPHYHIIIFNLILTDLKKYKETNGIKHYISKYLDEKWNLGIHDIEKIHEQNISYISKYTIKKITGANQNKNKAPEFILQSKDIGRASYEKYKSDMIENNNVLINKKWIHPLKYHKQKISRENKEAYELIKEHNQIYQETISPRLTYDEKKEKWIFEREKEKRIWYENQRKKQNKI